MKESVYLNTDFCKKLLFAFLILSTGSYGQSSKLDIQNVIEKTLKNNPEIRISKNNSLSAFSNYKLSLAEFDATFDLNTRYNKNKDPLLVGLDVILPDQESKSYSTGLYKKFDWGFSINPSLSVTQSDASLGNINRSITQSRFNFGINVPLLRNRGFLGTGASAEAAKITYKASKSAAGYSVSQQIRNSINLYLDLISAYAQHEIYKESEKRAENIVELTKVLIAADKRPARELDLVEANLAEKKRARINSEKLVYELKQNLLVQLGSDQADFKLDENNKITSFNYKKDISLTIEQAIETAHINREDLTALRLETKAKELLRDRSQRNLLNELNLNVNFGYSGLLTTAELEDLYGGILPEDKGFSYSIGLTYELPFQNSLQEGELISRKAAFDNNQIELENLKRNIRTEVLTSLNNLNLTKLELDQAESSVDLFSKSYENETLKQEKGLSTFFDVDQTERKLTNALLNRIFARTDFLKAIINYKHITGQLISSTGDDSYSVDVSSLFSLNNN